MGFILVKTPRAECQYQELKSAAERALATREKLGKKKSSRQEGLYKQVHKCLMFLRENPKHPSLHTHEYDSLDNPFTKNEKVFVAYAQNKTSGVYRIFWCYEPGSDQITIMAITQHP